MKHTIYLTSGQTAEVVSDGPAILGADSDSIYFERDGEEVARFMKEYVAGISRSPEPKNWPPSVPLELRRFGPIDTATGAASGAKA